MDRYADSDSFFEFKQRNNTDFTSTLTESSSSENTDEPSQLNKIRESQASYEFICLEHEQKKATLTEGPAFLSQLGRFNATPSTGQISGVNNKVSVTSFLDDTASGNSFRASHLPGVPSLAFMEHEHPGSTIANFTCFESDTIFTTEPKNNCLALDFERENAISFHTCLDAWLGESMVYLISN
jgi:hypothetical protein